MIPSKLQYPLLLAALSCALVVGGCAAEPDVEDDLGVSGQSASVAAPACLDRHQAIPVDNAQVIRWKISTSNQFLARAHVQGPLTKLYHDRNDHSHFQIDLGPDAVDTLEVVYSESFGRLPPLRLGMNVEACGDYITSTAQSGPYPASPDGAIIHWVHENPRGHGHESGFLVLDGTPYGWKAEGQPPPKDWR